jgi:hypothetical protein
MFDLLLFIFIILSNQSHLIRLASSTISSQMVQMIAIRYDICRITGLSYATLKYDIYLFLTYLHHQILDWCQEEETFKIRRKKKTAYGGRKIDETQKSTEAKERAYCGRDYGSQEDESPCAKST